MFVTRVEEKELPTRLAKAPDEIAEERRLLYVGLTRAKRHLFVTWIEQADPLPARAGRPGAAGAAGGSRSPTIRSSTALKQWRLERAREDDVPAYVVFHDSTLAEIAGRKPQSFADLATVSGVGPAKLQRYGDDVLSALVRAGANPQVCSRSATATPLLMTQPAIRCVLTHDDSPTPTRVVDVAADPTGRP